LMDIRAVSIPENSAESMISNTKIDIWVPSILSP
jgi:hypothetical protein